MKPLHGVTVLDISRLLPGGYASLLLKDLGARVIKLEQPGVGDYYRELLEEGILGSHHVNRINDGKETLGLDLKSTSGQEIFKKLVQEADIVIENFRPGVLKKLKLDYSVLRRTNPKIILCSITGFGQKGPDRHLGGHDLNYLGLTGLLSRIRDEKGNMVSPDFQITDLAAGWDASVKICAALALQRKTGKGSWIDASLLDAGFSISRLYYTPPKPSSTKGPMEGPGHLSRYAVYETSDQKLMTFAPLEPKFWIQFCKAVGKPQWIEDLKKPNTDAPGRRKDLEALFKQKTAQEWMVIGRRADLCLFPVVALQDLPLRPARPFPKLGTHTARILRSIGYSAQEIRGFLSHKVIA